MTQPNRSRETPAVVRVVQPFRDFLATEAAGGVVLVVAAVAALVWANSPWSESYHDLWATELSLRLGGRELTLDLRHWVNDGLMTLFFLVVGLEIKRELVDGHLRDPRAAALPAIGALGGMVVPALLFLALAGADVRRGWAIPTATDIALAVGVLTLLGRRVVPELRAFLLALAIVDDIGAIVIIAVVYSDGVALGWLAGAVACVLAVIGCRRLGVPQVIVYLGLGLLAWFALHEAGVHPTIAGVVLGLLAPMAPILRSDIVDADDLLDVSSVESAAETMRLARGSVSTVEWLEYRLHGVVSFAIVPLFALANSGIELTSSLLGDVPSEGLALGVIVGLVVGKPLGITAAAWLAVRLGVAVLPTGTSWRPLLGVAWLGGIGFTVAIFVTDLSLTSEADTALAKLAIGIASILSAALGAVLLSLGARRPPTGGGCPSSSE